MKRETSLSSEVGVLGGELLTVAQIAKEFSCVPRTVRRWIAQGDFVACTKVGSRRYFRRAAILQFFAEHESASGRRPARRTRRTHAEATRERSPGTMSAPARLSKGTNVPQPTIAPELPDLVPPLQAAERRGLEAHIAERRVEPSQTAAR